MHAREVNLGILTGICAGLHKPNGQTIADKILFMVTSITAHLEIGRSTLYRALAETEVTAAASG